MHAIPRPRIIGYRKNGAPIWLGQGGAPTIDELLLSIDVEEQQTEKMIQRSRAEAKGILAKARNDGRPNLTVEEDEDVENAMKAEARGKVELEGIRHKKARALSIKKSEAENDLDMLDKRPDPTTVQSRKPAYDQVVLGLALLD